MKLATLSVLPAAAMAQCIQCSRSAAAQHAAGIAALNRGIILLLIPVVALLAGFAFLAYHRRNP